MNSEELVQVFCDDIIYSLVRAPEHEPCRFGGPLERQVHGVEFGPSPLHLVAELNPWAMSRNGPRPINTHWTLPLFYGFRYSGCELNYQIKRTGGIEITDISPEESSDDFPYLDYPRLLPYAPLRVSDMRQGTYTEFADEFPNLAAEQPAEFIVCVPPPATLGASLWGPSGDQEGVVVVFECNLAEREVKAYNRCT